MGHDTVATYVWQDQLDCGLVVIRNIEIQFKLNGGFHISCSVTAREKRSICSVNSYMWPKCCLMSKDLYIHRT